MTPPAEGEDESVNNEEDEKSTLSRVVDEELNDLLRQVEETKLSTVVGSLHGANGDEKPNSGVKNSSSHDKLTTVPNGRNPLAGAESGGSNMRGFLLKVPNIQVPSGAIVAVVGHVGSGKSMLVETLLGGGPVLVQGKGGVRSNVGYVPQGSLIISGTVSENIIMGRPLDEESRHVRLSALLVQCATWC